MVQPSSEVGKFTAIVKNIERLNDETVRVRLDCPDVGRYYAGQYLSLHVDHDQFGYYSLGSAPGIDQELHVHVRRNPNGNVSRWIHEKLEIGAAIKITPPQGSCFYYPAELDRPLLMIGTGSGLAPLYGMIRTALVSGHRGPIHLYHGARRHCELYLSEQLRSLARLYRNFSYFPCVSREDARHGFHAGRALDNALREAPVSEHWGVYLSGNRQMVVDARAGFVQRGVPNEAIWSDCFSSNAIPMPLAATV